MRHRQGDIVVWGVTKKSTILSRALAWWFVRFGQGGHKDKMSYSHSGIYAGCLDGMHYVYESTWPKSRFHKIPLEDYKKYVVKIYQVEGLNDSHRGIILSWARANVDKWYDLIEIISLGLINLKKPKACSEFVRYAYLDAGIFLGSPNEYLMSPNEIVYETKKIRWVCDVKPECN